MHDRDDGDSRDGQLRMHAMWLRCYAFIGDCISLDGVKKSAQVALRTDAAHAVEL